MNLIPYTSLLQSDPAHSLAHALTFKNLMQQYQATNETVCGVIQNEKWIFLCFSSLVKLKQTNYPLTQIPQNYSTSFPCEIEGNELYVHAFTHKPFVYACSYSEKVPGIYCCFYIVSWRLATWLCLRKREPAMRGWFVFSPIQILSREIAAKNVVKWTRDPERNSIDIHACYFRRARNSLVFSLKE